MKNRTIKSKVDYFNLFSNTPFVVFFCMFASNYYSSMSKYDHPFSFYKEVFDSMHAGVYINQIEKVDDFSTASNIFINEYCIKMAGYTLDEFEEMGQNFFQRILKPEDVRSAIDSIQYLCNNPNETFSGLNKINHKNGYDFWVFYTTRIFRFKDGVPWQFINITIEIQDRIKTDLQLEKLIRENAFLKNQLKCKVITKREKEIIGLITTGRTDTEIADSLFISTNTARTHRKNILHKLGLSNTADLVRFAMESGLY